MTCPQFETCVFRGTPEKEALARQPWAQGQNCWVAWRNPHASPALPTMSSVLRRYVSHITGHFSNTAERRKTFSKVIFILSFWILFPFSRGVSPSPMDQGSALAGTGGAPLGMAVSSCRQVILPLSVSSLWLGNETPHVSTRCPHLSLLFIFPFISIPLLCHYLSFAYCLGATLPFPQPPQLSCLPCRVLATPLFPYAQHLPKVPSPV